VRSHDALTEKLDSRSRTFTAEIVFISGGDKSTTDCTLKMGK
jgi:hypothetical protein